MRIKIVLSCQRPIMGRCNQVQVKPLRGPWKQVTRADKAWLCHTPDAFVDARCKLCRAAKVSKSGQALWQALVDSKSKNFVSANHCICKKTFSRMPNHIRQKSTCDQLLTRKDIAFSLCWTSRGRARGPELVAPTSWARPRDLFQISSERLSNILLNNETNQTTCHCFRGGGNIGSPAS